ncbi:MAG: hypothetical protein ACPGOV_15960 [Magnetovibrionaceae bacterium]
MILVICMAGLNTRFHNVGFDVPKYLLPWNQGTVIGSILGEMTASFRFERIILLPNKRDNYFEDQLLEAVAPFDIGAKDIVFIGDTAGQAHTAALGAQVALEVALEAEAGVGGGSQIAFHNADTIIAKRDFAGIASALEEADAHIDIFSASSPQYSYVQLKAGKVVRIAEKNVISPFASSGLYAFRSIDFYLDQFNSTRGEKTEAGGKGDEIYIADLLQHILEAGGDISVNEISQAQETTVLGTPEEYGIEHARLTLARYGRELAQLKGQK